MTMSKNHPEKLSVYKWQKMGPQNRRKCCFWATILTTALLLLVLGFLLVFIEFYLDSLIRYLLSFKRHSEMYKGWEKTKPLHVKYFLYNLTNAREIFEQGAKPIVQELGPYAFREVREKVDIVWNDENDTITYRHKRTQWFDPENSVRNLSDLVTVVNIVPLGAAFQARYAGFFQKFPISALLSSKSSKYVTKTVAEILFDGYDDGILTLAKWAPGDHPDKFGIFYTTNGTTGYDGIYNMYTKQDDNFGKVRRWNYQDCTGFFRGKCGRIDGSAGEFFPLNPKRDYIEMFSPELGKVGRFEYEKDVEVKGIKGYKYSGRHFFDNGTYRPEDECFCSGECIPRGVLNFSTCNPESSPTFLSLPHFYNADPVYRESVVGLEATDDDEFFIVLEPKTGVIIDISATMQLNLLLQPVDGISFYRKVPKVFLPFLSTTRRVPVEDDIAIFFRIIQKLPKYARISGAILISLGSLAWVSYLLVLTRIPWNNRPFKRQKFEKHQLQSMQFEVEPLNKPS